MENALIFAADLGGTNLRAGAVDQNGAIDSRVRHPTPCTAADPDEVVQALVAAARECERQTVVAGKTISAASIAVAGIVDKDNAVIVRSPNIPCLDNFDLKQALQNELGWPVHLENDANAAAAGEMWMGAARGARTVICLTLGTGVGGGIILDGKLWRGADGFAGEIGHVTVEPSSSLKCNCGSFGCLEMFSSATAIVRAAREALPSYPDSNVVSNELTAKELYEAGVAGDTLAQNVFIRVGIYLGIGLASIINLLNPEVIVIGGGVANAWQLFEKAMHQEIAKRTYTLPTAQLRIVPAECGDDAGLLGVTWLAFDRQDSHD